MFCRCVAVDEEFYLLRVPPKGSPKNKNGQGFFTVAGTAILRANHWINHAAFDSFYDLHFVQPDECAKMRSAWKRDTGGCVAWQVEVGQVFEQPRCLPAGSQDALAHLFAFAFCGVAAAFP